MAQKVRTLFIDDLDGTPAEGTIRFALDGTEYEIDLSANHEQALRDTLARYVAAARRDRANRRPTRPRRAASNGPVSNSEVRAWAKSQGMEVKERGRMPAELVVKFQAATGN
ncbi:MAG TPA: Lsr2 family protein [Streptosporangiaceae bacterium]|nr:Lsr2 family protein [Streptosporangiaceae bacterium]